jgi:hypothetical protein
MSDHPLTLEERLHSHPILKKRIEGLLELVDAPSRDLAEADKVEFRVIEEVRRLGNEVLQEWASTQERKKVEELRGQACVKGHGEKNCIGTPPLAKSG